MFSDNNSDLFAFIEEAPEPHQEGNQDEITKFVNQNKQEILFFRKLMGFLTEDEKKNRFDQDLLSEINKKTLPRTALHATVYSEGYVVPSLKSNGCTYTYLLGVLSGETFSIKRNEINTFKTLHKWVHISDLLCEIKTILGKRQIRSPYDEKFPKEFLAHTLETLDSNSRLFKSEVHAELDRNDDGTFEMPDSFARKIKPISGTHYQSFLLQKNKHRKIAKLDNYFRLTKKYYKMFENELSKIGFNIK